MDVNLNLNKTKKLLLSYFLSEFVFFLFSEKDANIVLLRIFTFTAQLRRNMAFVAFSDICNHNALCRKCIPLGKNIIRECFQIFTIKMLSTNTFSYLQQHFPMNKDQILNVWSLYCIFSLGKISHQLFMVFLQKHHMITFYENDGIRES